MKTGTSFRELRRQMVLCNLVTSWLVLGWLAPVGYAQNAPLARFHVDQWTTEDGLPSHTINQIVQAEDGYLWMATSGGLTRFDGYRFTVYTPVNGNLPSNRITALFFSSPDTLWVGTEEGYVGTFVAGQFTHYSKYTARIDGLAIDPLQQLWVASYDAVVRLGPDSTAYDEEPLVPWGDLATDRRGDLWTILVSRDLARLQGNRFEPMGGTDRFKHRLIRYPARGEILRIRNRDANVEVFDAEGTTLVTFVALPDTMPWHILSDRTGRIWAGSRNRI